MKYHKTYFKSDIYRTNKTVVNRGRVSGHIKLKKLSKLRNSKESSSLIKIGWNHQSLVTMYYLKKLGVSFDFLN